jgi:hypothetical protein
MIKSIRGWIWMLRMFGWKRTRLYRRAYREGWVLDYSEIMNPDEIAILGEHFEKVPWER